jgi:hypothetical protein
VDELEEIRLDYFPFERLFVGNQQNVMVYSVETQTQTHCFQKGATSRP